MSSSALYEPEPRHPALSVPQARDFSWHCPTPGSVQHARFDESLLELVAQDGPVACLWQAEQSLVVPRTYRRFEAFEAASLSFAKQGWPITVRQTGGGIVPQGPGILNLSLAYRVEGPPLQHSEAGYQLICQILSDALNTLGIQAFPAAVSGSFCDGRYNLAVEHGGAIRKIAGTAQLWRRLTGTAAGHLGLVHALILLDTNTRELTGQANAFEAAIRSGRRYRADRVVSVSELNPAIDILASAFKLALEQTLTRD